MSGGGSGGERWEEAVRFVIIYERSGCRGTELSLPYSQDPSPPSYDSYCTVPNKI